MFSYHDDEAMLSKSRLKYQSGDQDWCTPSSQYVESREQYWGENRRGGNVILAEERDTQMPVDNYQYSTRAERSQTISARPLSPGPFSPRPLSPRAMSPPRAISPRQVQLHPKNQFLSRTEVASHMAAIKAVNDSLNSNSRGSVTVLKGLWRVFDAAVSELGAELQDSLSNKAIFEANVVQEKLNREGKPVSDFGRKADTLLRQRHYGDMLKFTMLRLRGSFADLILGTKKELQKSIDETFATQKAEMEKSFAKRSAEMEAKYTRQAFEAAQSFTVQLQEKADENERLRNELTQAQQMANMVQAQFSLHRDSEIERLQNELTQAQQMANMVQAQFNLKREEIERLQNEVTQAQQMANMVQAQFTLKRDSEIERLQNELTQSQQMANMAQAQFTLKRNAEIERLQNELTQSQQMASMAQSQFTLKRDSEIERLQNELTQAQQVANMVQAQFSLHRDSTSTEIARLENDLKQAEMLREQAANVAQAQLTQERENHRQAIANFDSGRESMVTKLSSTLETLQVQCATVHNLEQKLREAEANLHDTQDKLQDADEKLKFAEREHRQESEAMEHQLSLVNETAYLLQNKLDGEIKNKNSLINMQKELEKRVEFERERGGLLQQKFDHEVRNTDALINVQKELEKHLEFERARGDLLQQELELEIESKKEVVKSLHEASKQRHDEHSGVMKELNRVSEQLRRANEERSSLETSLNMLHAKCEEHDINNSQLKSELCIIAQGKEQLESELERVSDHLRRAHEQESTLKANLNILQASYEEQVRLVHESNARNTYLDSELQLSNKRVHKTTELSSLLETRVTELEAKIQDQLLDLEAARLSEEEVEKLLSDSLNEKQVLEARLTVVLAEFEETKARLSKADSEYGQDREKFATALHGFEEEVINAEAQMKTILESNAKLEAEKEAAKAKFDESLREIGNLKVIVQDLTESISKQTMDHAKQYETLKNNLEDELKNQEEQYVKMKNEYKEKVSKYESDIVVYEEAVKMLQKQVEILEELADSEREMWSSKMAETDETRHEDIKEEIRQEFLSRFDALKAEHESALTTKDADIAALHEKCQKRDMYIKQMERICVKVREDLLQRKEQKKKLWGSIERSIQHIKEAKLSKESTIYSGSTDIIEVVANEAVSLDSDVYNDFRSSILDLIPETDSFIGSDLQMLLKSFDNEANSE